MMSNRHPDLGPDDLYISRDADLVRGVDAMKVAGPLTIKFKKLHPDARVPQRMTADAAGMDLYAVVGDYTLLHPGERAVIGTGLAVELPVGWELQVRPRSGLALRYGVTVLNGPGTIDSDYRGEIGVILINEGDRSFAIQTGERVAQLVLSPVWKLPIEVVEELGETARGSGGFGSTGS